MREVEVDGERQFECSLCRMVYKSAAAARACEDIHLDERSGTRSRG